MEKANQIGVCLGAGIEYPCLKRIVRAVAVLVASSQQFVDVRDVVRLKGGPVAIEARKVNGCSVRGLPA